MINSQNMTSACDDVVAEDITPEQVVAARRAVAAGALKKHGDTEAARAEIREFLSMLGIAPGAEESLLTPIIPR